MEVINLQWIVPTLTTSDETIINKAYKIYKEVLEFNAVPVTNEPGVSVGLALRWLKEKDLIADIVRVEETGNLILVLTRENEKVWY